MKKIAVLGSTGSIGVQTLQIAEHLKDEISVTAIAARANIDLLEQQARKFHPKLIAVYEPKAAAILRSRLPDIQILEGMDGLKAVASDSEANLIISAMSGSMGLIPTFEAIKSCKTVALANKEALVSGGALIMSLAKQNNVEIIPIDSEHSAIFQCLKQENRSAIHRIILTASGGAFRDWTSEQLELATPDQALNHPNWAMGPKVTIDCSTLMNKGLEMIEAHWLFGVPTEKIEIVIHPQSIIHSIVEFIDYSMLAQMGLPSMIVPIQYAITFPERRPGMLKPFDFFRHDTLQFRVPNWEKFRCLKLAYQAMESGNSMSCFMNGANEALVHRFLNREIQWKEIATKLEDLMHSHSPRPVQTLDAILEVDREARMRAQTA